MATIQQNKTGQIKNPYLSDLLDQLKMSLAHLGFIVFFAGAYPWKYLKIVLNLSQKSLNWLKFAKQSF